MHGPNEGNWALPDLSLRETVILGSLAALILWIGLYPRPIFTTARPSLGTIQQSLSPAGDPEVRNLP
jgi:NADH:ubiquinone oxidoreductase subunit 4 (subunit M)